ncbi:OmpL47-type beta-barrel domain-containing protein [Actinospongicola halichondriae]|uniref:OmpL47-type beta-barrel domain-containing protein n=1 Tax=Actinospongicola halichondriae TaxID=3236844 RepID=UPI003D3D3DFB
MTAISPHLRRVLTRALAPIGFVVIALAVLANAGVIDLQSRRTAVPFPILAYEIEAVSDGHTATLLNLPLPNVGAPQAPIPVDVDGDLLPDVEVGVNLIDAEGLFNNPPKTGEIIAPNIEINRLVTASLLGQGTPPLKINVKLTVVDLEGGQPDTVVRFGYDTGEGGSIPPSYKAVVGGLDTFFNPITARIDTTGGLLNLIDPGITDLGLTPAGAAYQGPLTTFAALDNGPDLQADIDLEFSPMPQAIEVSYGSEGSTQSFTYSHDSASEVDLTADAALKLGDDEIDVTARIDRLPRAMAVDFGQDDAGAGFVNYDSASQSGRLADIAVDLRRTAPGERPINARLDLESLPSQLTGEWNVADEGTNASFSGSGQGIGAIEARITNYDGDPVDFDEWIPSQRQHVNLQAGEGGILTGDTFVSARLERIRGAEFAMAPDGGVEGVVEVGDGERPLEIHGAVDFRDADLVALEATTLISPLPDRIALQFSPPGEDQETDPTRIVYEASESIDVDVDLALATADTTGPITCGAGGTTCADLELRHVPDRIEARLVGLEEESRVEVDAVPRAGGAPLDMHASAVIGPIDADIPVGVLAAPINADIDVQGLPEYLRVRTVSGASETLERLEFHTCDRDYENAVCEPGTESEIGEIEFAVSNFSERPADLPGPSVLEPLFVSVVGRGLPDTNEVLLFEAAGRITDVRELQYLNVEDLFGVKADVGDNQDFRAHVDIEGVDLNGDDPADGRVDIAADVAITPLPAPFSFCTSGNGRPLVADPYDEITEPCEDPDPFDDGTVDTGPLTVAYRAPSAFDVAADFSIDGDLPFDQPDLPIEFGTFDHVAAQIAIDDVPGEFTAYVHTPVEPEVSFDGLDRTSTRIRTVAPGADDLSIDIAAQLTTPGVDCDDPDPEGGAVCAQVVIDGLPEFASVLQATTTDPSDDDAVIDQSVQFAACDLDVATLECRPGTEGEIGSIDVDARIHAGDPDGVDPYVAPADTPHIVALLDVDDLANLEAVTSVRLEELRGVGFAQDPEGLHARTDLGNGTEPLLVHAVADLRDTTDLVDDALRARVDADLSVTPLPSTFEFSQTGPGASQDEPVVITVESSEVVDFAASAEIREVGSGPDCGDTGTYCAGLEILDIPENVQATLTRTFGDIDGTSRDATTTVDLDLDHADGTPGSPDVHVDAAIGLPVDTELVGETPLFADFDLTGAPADVFVVMEGTERLASNGPDLEVAASELDRFLFITCEYDLGAEACEPGTEDAIDLVEASVRTFDLRPTDFPAPPADTTPLYVGVTGRGEDLEAQIRIPEISTVQYVDDDGLTAVQAALGGTTPSQDRDLQVRIDVDDLVIGDQIEIGDLVVDDPTVDLGLDVDITPFPGDLTFCTRSGGQSPVPTPSGLSLTAICEDTAPFGPDVTLDHTPLSIGFTSNVPFDVSALLDATLEGTEAGTTDAIDPQRIRGEFAVNDLPTELRAHFLQPSQTTVATPDGPVVEQSGPFRGLIDSPDAGSGIDLDFDVSYLVGENTVCKDPRLTVTAFCVSGGINDLPTHAELFYDPELDLSDPGIDLNDSDDVTNLIISTDGPADTTFETLEFSSVSPQRGDDGALLDPPAADVLIATLELDDLDHPLEIRGTLDLPDDPNDPPTATFDVQDGKTLPGMRVHFQNYIAPDPTIDAIVPDRPVGSNALDTYEITAIQRGDAFRLDADIIGVRGGGVTAVRDVNGDPIGTTAVRVDFADDFNVRAFADLQPDAANRILLDTLLEDIPAGIDVCVRGPREGGQVGQSALNGTWCDSNEVADTQGALEFATRPNTSGAKIDIDAFARLQFGGGSSVLAGRVDIDEIPQVLRVLLPTDQSEDVRFAGYSRLLGTGPLVPDGIDKIAFEAASFDLKQVDTGYVGTLPYDEIVNESGPFPAPGAPVDGREFLHAAVDAVESDFHVRGQIGRTDGAPSSQLQEVVIAGSACETPPNAPPDYPLFPEDGKTDYTCVQVRFDDASAGINPLSLHAEALLDDGVVVRLRDAGLSDVPSWIQMTLSDTEKYLDEENERGWRRPCGAAADEAPDAQCMAPMLRFDQPDDPHLFGVLEYGTEADIEEAAGVSAKALAPDFNSDPTGNGWDGQFDNDNGLRVKVVDFDNETPFDFSDDRLTARAAIRLPIPQSLTVDHPQTFNQDDTDKNADGVPVGGDSAADFRFRSAIRNSAGVPVSELGELAAMFAFADSDAQLLLTEPCAQDVVGTAEQGRDPNCAEFTHGVPIPGEIALGIYQRDSIRDIGDDRLRTSSLIQAEGRLSTPVSIGARFVADGLEVSEGIKLGEIEVAIRNIPSFDPNDAAYADGTLPSFRLRNEIIKDANRPEVNDDEPAESDPIFQFISDVDIDVNEVFAGFDFSPTPTPARRLDSVIYLDGTRIGADLGGFTTIAGNTPAPISAAFAVKIDPLDMEIRSVIDFPDVGGDVSHFLEDTLGLPGFISDIIGWLVDKFIGVIEDILNSFPIQVRLESDLLAQFTLDRVDRFTFRSNLLHATAYEHGPGSARVGPINLDMDVFHAGLAFDRTFDIPGWLDWIPGVPDKVRINFLLAGLEYDPAKAFLLDAIDAGLSTDLFENVLIEFRSCSVISQILPGVASTINQVGVDNGTEDFVIWPGSDPRIELGGFIFDILGISQLDFLLDYLAGPIFCNAFSVDAADYQGINLGTTDSDDYNPGNGATVAFAGHPVPGQPGQPDVLPLEQPDPSGSPLPTDGPPVASPGPDGPPAPPDPVPPRYAGGTQTVNGALALCGVHEFDALTVNGDITVATSSIGGNPLGTGNACPAGSEGSLELRANTLVVSATGSIDADAISSDVPNFGPDYTDYRATGNSGGTNAGVGFTGSFGDEGIRPYANADVEPDVLPGAPGSASADANSAGAAGLGGGAVILRADDALIIDGAVTADGGNGAGNLSGVCDADPDDNGIPGSQTYDHDNNAGTPQIPLPTLDPPYEHTGVIGAGGGAGGGIVFEARHLVDLGGATISAAGGNGGAGRLGAGGGGAGGVVKVLAPTQTGTGGLATGVVAGLNGADGGCADVPQTANPIDNDGTAPDGDPWETDGVVVIDQPPFAQLTPYGDFWWAGGAGAPAPITGWIEGGGGPGNVTVHTCAARLPTSAGPASAGALVNSFLIPEADVNGNAAPGSTLPTAANPCGARAGSTIVELDDDHVFSGAVAPEDAGAGIEFGPNVSGYYGLYTTAVRGSEVEDINGVEWIIGVDADRPTINVTAPAANEVVTKAVVTLEMTVADQADLSGLDFTECFVTGDTDWRVCNDGDAILLRGGNGPNTIQVRGYDEAGNVSLTAARTVILDQDAPEGTATLVPGTPDGNAGWYRNAPAIALGGYSAASPADDRPFVYAFDNGLETLCPVSGSATCTVSSTEVGNLSTGEHTFRYSAVNAAGVRYHDDNDPNTPSPMPSTTFRLDAEAPTVVLATVPTEAERDFGGDDWFDVRPFLVLSAIDQVGGSGVDLLEYRIGAGPWTDYDPLAPPIAPTGVTTVQYRATDVAGNTAGPFGQLIRVDENAPTLTLAAAGAPDGANGWYVSAPTITVDGYDDGTGVGADSDRFRFRIDNDGYVECDPTCGVVPTLETGQHLVHASAVDRFDNRSGESTIAVDVDLEAPETDLRIAPGAPAGANDWFLKEPFVELVSVDPGEGSGVEAIHFVLDGAPAAEYTGPFTIEPGSHTLCFSATDVAGNVEPTSCATFLVDIDDPDAGVAGPAVPASGHHTAPIVVTATGSDTLPGSDVDSAFDPDLGDLCDAGRLAEDPTSPSGQCVSVDGSPFVPVTGPITLGEGVHSVRTFTVDVAGRRSPIVEEVRSIDRSAPSIELRTLPPLPARNGWFRAEPIVVLRAVDGAQGSGVTGIEYRIDGGTWTDYVRPFEMDEGDHTVDYRATDAAGLVTNGSAAMPVDLTAPVIVPRKPSPKIWSRWFGPDEAELRWRVTENLAGSVEITVIVHDLTGNVVRILDGGTHTVTPGTPLDGATLWDGENRTLTGLVPLGVYFYRVVAVDEAGNVAHSGESAPIQIKLF